MSLDCKKPKVCIPTPEPPPAIRGVYRDGLQAPVGRDTRDP